MSPALLRSVVRALPVLALSCVLTLSPRLSADAVAQDTRDDGGGWPFGGGSSQGPMGRKLDLYNLGVLGAKARDANAAAPTGVPESGMRRVEMKDDPKPADDGPDRLRVELLYPDGPAAKAGLQIGDVITGVNGKAFKDGSLDPIAKAIVKAWTGASKGGVVTLTVERAPQKDPFAIAVSLPVLGKEWATPVVGKPREAAIDAAVRWLAQKQESSGGYSETLSGSNGAVVQTAVAGLCWLATGSDLNRGPYQDHLTRAFKFVTETVGDKGMGPTGGANWDQTNWGWTHAAVFAGELHARSPNDDTKAFLLRCGDVLAKTQETSGGWAHGPGGPNALGYVELNIVTGLALQGLGAAKSAGYAVPKDVLDRAKAYLETSSSGDGGVGYSTSPGQRGQGNIGRTAGAWLGCAWLGLRKDGFALKMEKYVRGHAGEVFGGHASLMQHYLFAGVAAQAIGPDAAKAYWSVCERDYVLAQAPDGSFQPRPWHESIAMQSNSDVSFGEVWTTAAWTLVVAAAPGAGKDGRPGLPAWTSSRPPDAKR